MTARVQLQQGKFVGVKRAQATKSRRMVWAALVAGAVALSLGLSGCASLAPAPQSYDLSAAHIRARASAARIHVAAPSATPPFDGDLIVVRGADGSLSRVPGARWTDRLPALVESRIAQSFENAGLVRQIAISGEGADYALAIEIRRFDIDAGARMAEVVVTGRLISNGGQTVAAHVFSASEPVADISGGPAAVALGGAAATVFGEIVNWAVASAR
jgi:cholesterol transport system auxiliary component